VAEKPAGRVEALDFVISVMKEHEKRLDKLALQLEAVVSAFAKTTPMVEPKPEVHPAERGWPSLHVSRWQEFRAQTQGARTIAFQVIENILTVSAWVGGMIYIYTERVPLGKVTLECGYESHVSGPVSTDGLRDWLAVELKVKPGKLVEGFLI
jgi:hypothetical protein